MQALAALITAAFALCGTAITVFWGNKSGEKNLQRSTDVIVYRLGKLEQSVDYLSKAVNEIRREKPFETKRQFTVIKRPKTAAKQN